MAKKFRLLLLDANVVIELFRQGIWDSILECCDIHLARSILREAHFYKDDDGCRHDFDLRPYEASGEITVFDVSLSQTGAFAAEFDVSYTERFDPGETESLVHVFGMRESCLICSADSIVYKVLGNSGRSEQGVSLQELLRQTGMNRDLQWPFTEAFRKKWTDIGFRDGLAGRGGRVEW